MIRVAAWTGGLFAVGCAISLLFPGPLVEPLVLLALGAVLLFLSAHVQPPGRVGVPEADRTPDRVRARAAR